MSYNIKNGILIVDTEKQLDPSIEKTVNFIINYKETGKSAIAFKKNGSFGIHIEDEIYTPSTEE